MLFWWICGGESVLPVLLLRHLGSSSSFPIFIPHQATTYFIYDKLTKLYKENIKLNLNKSKASKEMILKMKIMYNKKIYQGETQQVWYI